MAFNRSKIPLLKERREIYQSLASWYGEERAATEIAAHTQKARPIGEILQDLSGEILTPDAAAFAKVASAWESIAGKTVARIARPAGCRDKVITLGVRHSALVTEMRPSLDLLKEKINRELGEDFCRELRLVVD